MKTILIGLFLTISTVTFSQLEELWVYNNTTDKLWIRPAYETDGLSDCVSALEPIPQCLNPGSVPAKFTVPDGYNVFRVRVYRLIENCTLGDVVWTDYGIKYLAPYTGCSPDDFDSYTLTVLPSEPSRTRVWVE
ncbi:MAG: hypothetical protein HWE22_02385 [Flavobacteriales bacterium]|nr:hypothetical protein [Flavobacteriales bacterium]